jgi:hypothetical protein
MTERAFIIERDVKLGYFCKKVQCVMTLLNMASSEIAELVPDDVIERLKGDDPNPTFRAYVVGHEGTAFPKEVGAGGVILRWFKSTIQKLVNKLQLGTKIFHGHNVDSSHEGRASIGELVGKAVKTVKDKLSAIAVMYIKPEFAGLPLNIASVEADVEVNPNEDDSLKAVDVLEVTGIALGNSKEEKPAFTNAKLIGEFQAFLKDQSSHLEFSKEKEMDKITIDEMRTLVKKENIAPSDVFGREALTEDPVVTGFVKAEIKEATAGEYAHRKRGEKGFEEDTLKMKEQIEAKDAKIKELTKKTAKTEVSKLFKTETESRKFTEKQTKFIESKIETFDPTEPDKVKEEFGSFLDTQVQDYKSLIKAGIIQDEETTEKSKEEEKKESEQKKKSGVGASGSETKGSEISFLPSIEEVEV